jgi:transcriptional regulator with PAS, ATPase and Fis domain
LLNELESDESLPRRLERLREGPRDGAHALRLAVVAALLGEREEAEAALRGARETADPVAHACAAGFVALEAGDARRAIVVLGRARGDALAAALASEAHASLGAVDDAEAQLVGVPHGSWQVRLAAASVSLLRSQPMAALETLGPPHGPGVLGAKAMRLRAEAWIAHPSGREERRARDELSAAVWRLVRLGAPAELGRCYLLMADVETALGGGREQAARWLARAHPLLVRAGTPLDEERLRRAFRRFGRRAIDRLVDPDLERVIEGARRTRAAVLDLARAGRDQRAAGEGSDAVDAELHALLARLGEHDEELIGSLEVALIDREQTGKLVAVCRDLLLVNDPGVLDEELPRLARELGGEWAELLRADAGSFRSVSSSGNAPADAPAVPNDALVAVVRSGAARVLELGAGRASLVPIRTRDGARVLVLRQAVARGKRSGRDEERLAILGSVATAAFESAHAAAAAREAAARDAATLESIREGILTLDAAGRVRSLNSAALGVLGVLREDVEGRSLASLPGLAPLADAIRRGLEDEPVRLPKTDVLVRVRAYAGGVVVTLQELERAQKLAHRLVGSEARFTFDDLVGEDPVFLQVIADARRVAHAEVPALITGESGTGKELLAQAIHNASPRASQPFVGVNVAAIPRELLESELFGYEAGAFTGARARGHPGRFELADRGTILLDEIGDMPLEMQAKLLRVLQERSIVRLGGTRAIPVRARLLATTHRDLEQAVKDGAFRLDLFYRLRVVHLKLPPLRARKGDVAVLARHHLAAIGARSGRPSLTATPTVLAELERYAWPGNVRELANLLEGVASLLPRGQTVISETPAALRRAPTATSRPPPPPKLTGHSSRPPTVETLDAVERRAIEHALEVSGGNLARAARMLGVARNTLYNKLARYGLKAVPNS